MRPKAPRFGARLHYLFAAGRSSSRAVQIRLRKLRRVLASLLLAAFLSSASAQAADPPPLEGQGDLAGLIGILLSQFDAAKPINLNYEFVSGPARHKLNLRVYYSNDLKIDRNDNRCTAAPAHRRIICDVRLVDRLLEQFKLSGPGSLGRLPEKDYRRILLTWIIAHEIGHVALSHPLSDFDPPLKGFEIYDHLRQRKELEADEFAISIIGRLDAAPPEYYSALLDIANSLLRKALCPATYPALCSNIHPGVGLLFNHSNSDGIRIQAGGTHPEYIARFVRLIYLAGTDTNINSINFLARQVIEKLVVETQGGPMSVSDAIPKEKAN